MKINISLIAIAFITLLLTSCGDDDTQNYTTLDGFYKSNLNPEKFKVDADNDILITGSQGTRLTIPKSALPNTDGDVTVSFKEFFKKSELILNNIPTNTIDGRWLETGGSFFLDVENSDGDRVFLRDNITLEFPISDNISDPTNMAPWFDDSEGTPDFIGWRSLEFDPDATVAAIMDTIAPQYIMFCPGYQWINCDYVFESTAEKTPIKVRVLNTDLDIANIDTYIVFKDINAVIRLNESNGEFESFEIPVDEEIFVVGIGFQDESYLNIDTYTSTKDQEIEILLEKISEDDLKEALEVLD